MLVLLVCGAWGVGRIRPEPIVRASGDFAIIDSVGADAAENETAVSQMLINDGPTRDSIMKDAVQERREQVSKVFRIDTVQEAEPFQRTSENGLIDGGLGEGDGGWIGSPPPRLLQQLGNR